MGFLMAAHRFSSASGEPLFKGRRKQGCQKEWRARLCRLLPEAAASEPLADEGCKVFEKEIRGEGWISTGKERDSVAL